MREFASLPWLYLKEWLLLAVCALAAMGYLDLGSRLPLASGRSAASFAVALPLGVAGLLASGYLALRIAVMLGLPAPFVLSVGVVVAVAVVGLLLFVFRRVLFFTDRACGWSRPDARQALAVALVLVALVGMGLLPLLPLAGSGDIVFYAGSGTDATGYVRAARSMMEGWYFRPVPRITMSDVLYHTDRAWTFGLIAINDRPVTFYLIGAVATLTRLDPFQAYLVVESMAVVVVAAFAAFLVLGFSRSEGRSRAAALLLALGLVMLAGLTGDLFRQYLGHVWSIVTGVVVAPAVFWTCLRAGGGASVWPVCLATFMVALISIGTYDVRFALFTVAASLGAWALVFGNRDWRKLGGTMIAAGISGLAASWIGGSAAKDLAGLRAFNLNQFPVIRFSVDDFLVQAGLQIEPTRSFRLVLAGLSLSFVVAHGFLLWRTLRTRREPPSEEVAFRFLSSDAFLIHLGSLVAVGVLVGIGNNWAAQKTLHWVTAAQVTSGTLWLVALGDRGRHRLAAATGVAILGCAVLSVVTTWRWSRAVIEQPARYGVIDRNGLLRVGAELETLRPQVVWFEGNIPEWLLFYSCFHDGGWATLAPYPLWYHGGGLFLRNRHLDSDLRRPGEPRDVLLKRLYGEALHQPGVQGAGTVVAVLAEDATAGWPEGRCGKPYCLIRSSVEELMQRAAESAR